MLKIYVPENHLPERRYVIDVLFKTFLGLNYEVVEAQNRDTIIELVNGARIVFKDSFFSADVSSYLKVNALPKKVLLVQNPYLFEKDLPVLYGNDEFLEESDMLVCGIDIIGSTFFMLSRWEEHVIKTRDKHQRFSGKQSIAYKFKFLTRPIVNEYVEMLWSMLANLGIEQERKHQSFEIIPTHDVDSIHYPVNLTYLMGDLLHLKSIAPMVQRLKFKNSDVNPYDTFDWLMDVSEKNSLTSRFYFMAAGVHDLGCDYDLNDMTAQNILKKVQSRGHVVGFHPGYKTYNDPQQWQLQKSKLEDCLGESVSEGRQHYLRFANPETWRIWENNQMATDSTMCFADTPGFRCGTANNFPVFDVVKRQALKLEERPLIVMETPLHDNKNIVRSLEYSYEIFNFYKGVCEKYAMPYTILFHNSNFEPVRWEGWKELYESVVK